MSTPEVSVSNNKCKYSPFLSSGINKSLLTPCRQVGLSRKRKTPSSSTKNLSDLNSSSNISIISTNSCSEMETTPVSQGKIHRSKRSENLLTGLHTSSNLLPQADEIDNKCSQKNRNKLSKRDLLQTFTSEELFDSDDSIIDNKELTGVSNSCEKLSFIESVKACEDDEQILSEKQMKLQHRRLSDEFPVSIDVCQGNEQKRNQEKDDSDEDFIIKRYDKNKQGRTKEKKFTLRKSLSCATDDLPERYGFIEKKGIKDCNIRLQRLSENEIHSVPSTFIDENKGDKMRDRKCNDRIKTLCMRTNSSIIDDDADFFTSTPEEEKIKRKNLEKKIKAIENEVKRKKLTLENLQRASVYKNKHNIQDLKHLTSLWLNGCVQILKDLLAHLQAHGPIDLTTLLNNMQIPKEIIEKLPL